MIYACPQIHIQNKYLHEKKLCTAEHRYKYVKSVDCVQLATTGEITPDKGINDYAISLTTLKLYKIHFRFSLNLIKANKSSCHSSWLGALWTPVRVPVFTLSTFFTYSCQYCV